MQTAFCAVYTEKVVVPAATAKFAGKKEATAGIEPV
jgi:hypothetical protein